MTFAMIKPEAVQDRIIGKIIDRIEQEGFSICRMTKMQLTRKQAEELYAIHKERSFFGEMIEQIISNPVVLLVLERDNAIKHWRDVMGATDPAKAESNTLRKLYGKNIGSNAVHGSDSPESARTEIGIFYPEVRC